MKNKLIMASVAVCLVGLTACKGNDDTATPNGPEFKLVTYSGHANYTLKGTAKLFDQQKDVVYTDSVSLIIPEKIGDCDVSVLRDSILSKALSMHGKPVRECIDAWLDSSAVRQSWLAERISDSIALADSDMQQGFDIVSGFIVNLTPDMLVYCVKFDSYAPGAAHGLSGTRHLNYTLEGKGSLLTLDKLFTPQGLKELPVRIAEQAEAMSDLIGATTVTALPEDGDFYISSEGEIVFSYQPYEIASYAQGIIDIPFYPYELLEYMTPYAVELFNLQDLDQK
ncbi:MAG: RsiV family protein [Bacteroidales bacterium]|nr:RsiV family protein [Bacteroidales bacterium]